VVLNLVTTPFDNTIGITDDQKLKYVAATISIMSEYLFNSTPKIQESTTKNIQLLITYGLKKLSSNCEGFEKVLANITYLLSNRFIESDNATLYSL